MSWVDDCPSGILEDCFLDKKPDEVLTQTQAAFRSYDRMLGQTDSQREEFRNYWGESREIWGLFILLILIGIFLYRG